MSDNYQFTSLIRGNLLGLRNDHETEISAIAVNHSNSVIQIRESSAQCDISTYRKSRGERSSSPIPCAALLLGGLFRSEPGICIELEKPTLLTTKGSDWDSLRPWGFGNRPKRLLRFTLVPAPDKDGGMGIIRAEP
jgi:hypothetical protein